MTHFFPQPSVNDTVAADKIVLHVYERSGKILFSTLTSQSTSKTEVSLVFGE
jgi:hypothetical protein